MILFKKITFKNFLSIGNQPVSLNLNEDKTTLIHGTNGSGKSSILDALCFSLYGKPFRKINLPQLINTQNKKGLLVEVEFSIGNDSYLVRRGQKPKVFEIWKNGEIIEAKAASKDNQEFLEQNILKLTFKSFTQIVILGSSSYIPFMQLPLAGRRECIEDFLDIKVFSTMSTIAKERFRGLKDKSKDITNEIEVLEFKLQTLQEKVDEAEENSAERTTEIEKEIRSLSNQIESKFGEIEPLKKHLLEQEELMKESLKNNPGNKLHKMSDVLSKLTYKKEKLEDKVKFYKDNDSCHSCSQPLDEKFKLDFIEKSSSEIGECDSAILQAQGMVNELEFKLQFAQERNEEATVTKNKINLLDLETKNLQSQIDRLHKQLQTDVTESITKDKGKIEILTDEILEKKKVQWSVLEEIQDHEVVVSLLKDSGIKTQIVKRYLPVMNKFIKKYLTDLDFPIHFELDDEFKEIVRSPLHQDFSYASFSEGQKGRIDISLMLTWREICKLKNSVSTNILVLDEVFSSSLDETGKECLMGLLKYRLDSSTNVFVVDHTLNDAFKEKFDKSVLVERIQGFSRYS